MDNSVRAIEGELRELSRLASEVAQKLAIDIARVAATYARTLRNGGTLYFAGNGGSAADAQHIATEYVVRYATNRKPLPAVAITTDTSLLTACGNDFSFDDIFARQVQALMNNRDLLVLHSTSGESRNVVRAAEQARVQGVGTVAFLGKGGGRLVKLVNDSLVVPSSHTSHIQELHLAIEHTICGLVEAEFAC